MNVFINVLTAWIATVLLVLLSIIIVLRISNKKYFNNKNVFLTRINKFLRKFHIHLGVASIVIGLIHGIYSSDAAIGLNFGTLVWVLCVALGATFLFKKAFKPRKLWMTWHRVLTALVIIALVVHIVDVGIIGLITSYNVTYGDRSNNTVEVIDENGIYEDGIYLGVADGFGSDLTVEVTIKNDEITNIEIISHNERKSTFYQPAFDSVPSQIIDSQSTDVDAVSGSTMSSYGIMNAVNDALSKALMNNAMTTSTTVTTTAALEEIAENIITTIVGDSEYEDGSYLGVADGFGSNLTVEVTIKNDEITNIEIISHNEKNAAFYKPAFDSIPSQIISSQSTDVDAVSGSTMSSYGIMNAVNDALSKAATNKVAITSATATTTAKEEDEDEEDEEDDKITLGEDNEYKDGIYTGVANGYSKNLIVEVTIKDNSITDLIIISHNEVDKSIYQSAFDNIPTEIIENQTPIVDAVSGATMSSYGIMNAVNQALSKAQTSGEAFIIEYENPKTLGINNIYKDGTYTGIASGYGPNLTVEVIIKNNSIADIKITTHSENKSQYYKPAFDSIPSQIMENQNPSVDAVSGSTMSSYGIMNAVNNALNQALISGEEFDIN